MAKQKETANITEVVDPKTGEVFTFKDAKLNDVLTVNTKRLNGTVRVRKYFDNCPTLTEQHGALDTDINHLMQKYQPDELAAYIAARNNHRIEILHHDFSKEPSKQEAMNVVYQSRKNFDELPDDIKMNFKNHVEFLKFIDNPANQEKMIKMGLLTRKKIEDLQIPVPLKQPTPQTTTTSEEADKKA